MTDTDVIQHILRNCPTIAVVGLSPKPHRASFEVAQYMQRHGWRIIPINPLATQVLGETAYPSLVQAAAHARIDLVNVFRHSEEAPALVAQAIAIGAKAVWLQVGIEHAQAALTARQAGLDFIQNKCLKVEHAQIP